MKPPIEPMLAELKDELPNGDFFYEPKLDGFRGMLFAGHDRLVEHDCKDWIVARALRAFLLRLPPLHLKN